jgi:hypothetical protein
MRRVVLFPLILFFGWSLLSFAQTSAAASKTTVDAETDRQVAAIRDAASRLIASGTPEDVAKGAALLEKASEIEQVRLSGLKSEVEKEKLLKDMNESNGAWKGAAEILTPFITTIVLAGTLCLNMWQARVAAREKREDAKTQADKDEKARFTDVVEMIVKMEHISQASTLISSFTEEPYKTLGRGIAMTLLRNAKSMPDFENLFTSVTDPSSPDYLSMLLPICRTVREQLSAQFNAAWDYKNSTFNKALLPPDKLDMHNLLAQEDWFLSVRLAAVLKRPRTPGEVLDLRGIGLTDCEIRGADLQRTILTSAVWTWIDVDDVDFGGITEFYDANFWNTAWWRAKRIEGGLLEYLKERHPYVEGREYKSRAPVSKADYDERVATLTRDAMAASGAATV